MCFEIHGLPCALELAPRIVELSPGRARAVRCEVLVDLLRVESKSSGVRRAGFIVPEELGDDSAEVVEGEPREREGEHGAASG